MIYCVETRIQVLKDSSSYSPRESKTHYKILCCHAGILKEFNLLVYTYIVSSVVRLLRWQWVKNIYIKKEMESLTNTMIYVPHMETSRKNRKNTLLLSISQRRYKALYGLSYDLLFILTIIFWYVSITILSNWFIYFYYFGLSSFPCREKIHFKFHVRSSTYYGVYCKLLQS